MSLLTLKNIGKIYVSGNTVTVGIRNVNLSFEKGEFVAVTGASGSGKSTLLNVISGMDSYEEGELYINGEATSHYAQGDWEDYRNKYISFIFQDYNIIESFTVLQNVELALIGIKSSKERRKRALALLDRVGMRPFIHQKGSKLSGGQKQRTVIARALAKDSPIILADEPTGNLDYSTSLEIVKLLKEVSKDKLLIMVTHNFEQVKDVSTRHIRIFDGAVESDVCFEKDALPCSNEENTPALPKAPLFRKKKKTYRPQIKLGAALGKTIFFSRPRLSVFLCLLMIIGSLGMYFATALCGSGIAALFEESYMFTPMDGRVVIAKRTATPFTEEELQTLARQTGAAEHLRFDFLFDNTYYCNYGIYDSVELHCSKKNPPKPSVGRLPEKENEVLLSLPLHYKTSFGAKDVKITDLQMEYLDYKVVGVHYYSDNNKQGTMYLTPDGFSILTGCQYLFDKYSSPSLSLAVTADDLPAFYQEYFVYPSFELQGNEVKICSPDYKALQKSHKQLTIEAVLNVTPVDSGYDSYTNTHQTVIKEEWLADTKEVSLPTVAKYDENAVLVSTELLKSIGYEILDQNYHQGSLFFENDRQAKKAIKSLFGDTYIALSSYTTYTPSPVETIISTIASLFLAILWVMFIIFIAFFIHICSTRTLNSFKGDMAIMRSMGISADIVKIGIFVRMLIALVPGFAAVLLCGLLVATIPQMNALLDYLYFWQYLMLFAGMIAIVIRVTAKQTKKLFGESVKKSLSKKQ